MNASTLSDRELNEAIASELGWEPTPSPHSHGSVTWNALWHRSDDSHTNDLPDYATSLDALSEPEQRVRDAGWQSFHSEIDGITHWGWRKGAEVFSADDEKEARARALACLPVLAALKALAEVQK